MSESRSAVFESALAAAVVFLQAIVAAFVLAAAMAPLAKAQTQTSQVVPGSELFQDNPRRGWHFYQDPVKPKEPEEAPVPEPEPTAPPVPKQPTVVIMSTTTEEDDREKCLTKETWSAGCGFVDPGDDFEFQAMQRDILLQQMSMRPDVPEAVEAAQYYMKWVVAKASAAANMWYFNRVQNPDLDPTVKNPISEVGLALASRAADASQVEYFRILREEGAVLFFFSRMDCQFCHDQLPYTRRVAHTMGLRLINIPLDGQCLEGFVGDDCGDNIKPEQTAILQVRLVPTLFLYVPENTWIRLGTGIMTDTTVLANAVNFFSAYRAALIQGLDNSKGVRPTVSFNPEFNQKPTGVVEESGQQPENLPSREKLLELMGYGTAVKSEKQ